MALLATTGTWFVTALGASVVFFFKNTKQEKMDLLLGFSAGVMIAASFWSLLEPAVASAEAHLRSPAWLIVAIGFLSGAALMRLSDAALTQLQQRSGTENNGSRLSMLMLSITLHNFPEGLAVGVAFGALHAEGYPPERIMGVVSIALGIALQNFPEGAAVSLPMRREGHGRFRSFLAGQASALVEPLGGFLGALAVVRMQTLLPFALSFAAGAMILVTVHELIPTCNASQQEHPYRATMSVLLGFTIMMLLDVALG
ncbi:MAG: ZIP family metal transporter [Oscillospiraceae bacterium]|nr:ZIP family metal transporter [Oscillospiraceae bacterium]